MILGHPFNFMDKTIRIAIYSFINSLNLHCYIFSLKNISKNKEMGTFLMTVDVKILADISARIVIDKSLKM